MSSELASHVSSATEIKKLLLEVAREFVNRGPGYSQESVVIREASNRLQAHDSLEAQQILLTCWHDLFRDGELSWGFNVDNPGPPFFHFRTR